MHYYCDNSCNQDNLNNNRNTSETSVSLCETTQHKISEESHLRSRLFENLNSYSRNSLFLFCETDG
jgi:hypothetical protein